MLTAVKGAVGPDICVLVPPNRAAKKLRNAIETNKKGPVTYTGDWVENIIFEPKMQQNQQIKKSKFTEENLENSITLPKGVEISIGLYETKIESNQDKNEDPKLVYSPPIIVPLHSGTIFAVTVKEEENDDT